MNQPQIAFRRPAICLARRRQSVNGFTLVELLVVVAILGMLVSISAAVILPLREGRDIREAARSINAYLAAAQNRAMATQRPVGVWINRFNQSNMALEFVAAEVPPPYTGDYLTSTAIFKVPTSDTAQYKDYNQAILRGISGVNDLIQPGDYIRFGFKGRLRRITSIPGVDGETCTIMFLPSIRYVVHDNINEQEHVKVPFEVYRFARPARSATAPLLLPSAVAIDISKSGIGVSNTFTNFGTNPAILFGPSGEIERIIDGNPGAEPTPPIAPIHLLIGRPEKIGDDNLTDPNNLWLTIDHRTGRLSTSEVFTLPGGTIATIAESRKFAIDAQGISSR